METQWSLVLFTVISGIGAWSFATSMLQALANKGKLPSKVETIVSMVLLIVGGIVSATHLKHVDRIFEALNHPTSGIFVEAALIGVLCVLLFIYLVMIIRKVDEKPLKVVGTITMLIAIVFPFMCGYSYMMSARQAWMTIALPLAYCLTPAAGGAGLAALLKAQAGASKKELTFTAMLTCVFGLLGIVVSAAFFAYASGWLGQAQPGCIAWIVATFVCGIISAIVGAYGFKKPENALACGVVACLFSCVCAIAMRVGMWAIGTPLMDFFQMPME